MENTTKNSFLNLDESDFENSDYSDSNKNVDRNESIKIKNRIAAKKFRDKKNAGLIKLEMENDNLVREVLNLSYKVIQIKTENKMLEENINFFQSFLQNIMKKKQIKM